MRETVQIERLADSRAGIGHLANGKVLFVDAAAPGDMAVVEVSAEKGSYATGELVQLLEPSPNRREPRCPHVAKCGGCSWQHIHYPIQLEAKRMQVIDALTRIGGIERCAAEQLVAATLPSPTEFYYRNKLELGAKTEPEAGLLLGFYRQSTHSIAKPDTCILAHKPIAAAPKTLRGALRYLQGHSDLGIYRVGVRHSSKTGQCEVAIWTQPGPFPRSQAARVVGEALNCSSIVRVIANRKEMRKVKQVEVLAGHGYWREELAGLQFCTSAPAFFQVNTGTAELLVDEVAGRLTAGAGLVGRRPAGRRLRIADLYAGGGTFALALGKAAADSGLDAEVTAVESVGASVRDLRRNAEACGLDIDVAGGDAERILPGLGPLDALVVDPPRSGLAPGIIAAIAAARPSWLAYVSCNPATWARDIARLYGAGYRLTGVQPIDQFPQTPHVELASFLEPAAGGA